MLLRRLAWILGMAALLGSCGAPRPSAELTIAAAANLMDVFGEIGRAFQAKTGIHVVLSFGSTVQLAQQIENGAPFDLFAAADTQHIDALVSSGKLSAGSRAVYALGRLALWVPGDEQDLKDIRGLADSRIRFVAVAQPDLAPYGEAAVEALKSAHLWESVKPKLVYANNINQTRQLALSGNADAAFTAYSLVLRDQGSVVQIDPHLYRPIEQAIGIVASSPQLEAAQRFRAFLLGPEGRAILSKSGYSLP